MKQGLYIICMDGSNDNSIREMFPITVTVELDGEVVTRFFDMCTGVSGTAEGEKTNIYVTVQSMDCS